MPMTVNRKLLEILVCPITKQPVCMLPSAKLAWLNQKIAAGTVTNHAGEPVTETLTAALITENGNTIFAVVDSIPVMLEGESIATLQFGDWQDSGQTAGD